MSDSRLRLAIMGSGPESFIGRHRTEPRCPVALSAEGQAALQVRLAVLVHGACDLGEEIYKRPIASCCGSIEHMQLADILAARHLSVAEIDTNPLAGVAPFSVG